MIIHLTDAERSALAYVIDARCDNVIETRLNTGDNEFDQTDEDQCSVLVFMLNDLDVDPDSVASMDHLWDAVWIALDTPDAFPEVDFTALGTGAQKLGYPD